MRRNSRWSGSILGALALILVGVFGTLFFSEGLKDPTNSSLFEGALTAFTILWVIVCFGGAVFSVYMWVRSRTNRRDDPLEQHYDPPTESSSQSPAASSCPCPLCGAPVDSGDHFCKACGKELPRG